MGGARNCDMKFRVKDPFLRWLYLLVLQLFLISTASAEGRPKFYFTSSFYHVSEFENNASYVPDGTYYGAPIGKISNLDEGVGGTVFSVDKSTIFIRNFTYSGKNARKKLNVV